MAGNAAEPGRSVTSKVTAILLTYTTGQSYSLSELAGLTGLSLSTTHRLARELADWRLLKRTERGSYAVGLPLQTPESTLDRTAGLARHAPHVLEDLSAATRRPVRLGVLDNLQVSYIEKRRNRPITSFGSGTSLPAHATAVGKALLAFAPPATLQHVLNLRPVRFTDRTLTRPDELRHSLSAIRLTRVAVAESEFEPGVSAVAVPVCGTGGLVIAAIEVEVEDLHSGIDAVRPTLTVAARSLSRELACGSHTSLAAH